MGTPLSLRTALSPPPRHLDTLGVLVRPDSFLVGTTTLMDAQTCFKGLRKATRFLLRHVRNFRRFKYGKALLRMIVKKPSAALESILRSLEGKLDTFTLPTDLFVLRDEKT